MKDKIMTNAKKIVLGKRPETFAKTVIFPMLDGTTGCIPLDYVYRTRTEHAEFVDKIKAGIEVKAKAEAERLKAEAEKLTAEGKEVPDLTQVDLLAYQTEAAVDTIMGAVKGWGLDIPFDREAVKQLVDELPAAVNAIISDYREAITEGRLGN